jgi:transposase
VANDGDGWEALVIWLGERGVGRVGLEATAGYERGIRARLEAAGLEVVVHQPLEVKLFARLKRRRAKTDRLDAALIAAATAQVDKVRAAQDPCVDDLQDARVKLTFGARSSAVMCSACCCSGRGCWP